MVEFVQHVQTVHVHSAQQKGIWLVLQLATIIDPSLRG